MFNILVWYWGRKGGPAPMTLDLVRALISNPNVSPVLSLSTRSELFLQTASLGLRSFDVDTYSGPTSALIRTMKVPRITRDLTAFVRDTGTSVAVCMMRHLWSPAAFPAMQRGGGRILMILHDAAPHPGDSYPFWQSHLRVDLRATDGLVMHSEHVRDAAIGQFNYPAERTWVIPHASPSLDGGHAKPKALPTARPVRLLFFGRILAYKGLDILAEAFRILCRDNDVELRICGSGRADCLQTLADIPRVEIYNEWVDESKIPMMLEANDIVVVPYREASQSGVIPLAYAAGLPVIATPVGGLVEQVHHEETGLIAKDTSAKAFADAMQRIISDPDLYCACSAGALRISRSTMSSSIFAQRLCEAARQLSELPPRRVAAQRSAFGGRAKHWSQ